MSAKHIIRKTSARHRLLQRLAGALGLAAAALLSAPAMAQSAYCDNLRAQIAAAGNNSGSARYRAAAATQQKEIDRTVAYGHSIGCDRQQFLFFGNAPPPQCGAINGRIAQMRSNLAALQQNSGDGQRQALQARFDQQCRQPQQPTRVASRQRNIFEELFGSQEEEPTPVRELPLDGQQDRGEDDNGGPVAHGGSLAVCVRACDGGFFPISYSARRANLADLQELCRAQCPNVEVTLYTRSPSRDIETAVSMDGEAYGDHPNALKFTKSYDPTCSCRPPGRSWAETLAEAERLLAERNKGDLVVSAEKAEEMSRPIIARTARGAVSPNLPATEATQPEKRPVDAHETTREIVGADGVKKRVRVIAPTL
ncbi:DUF2865 domain-containing protein [Methylosinus sp. LW4]|uniref:DUF2865 domain-containing protein n=1 Tax=Methylosinus sp. LW4 TaxID=136993 RepID=UPI0012F85519|nr:DUF2865 domain-containing protein [Methylosinus sp. LW4]